MVVKLLISGIVIALAVTAAILMKKPQEVKETPASFFPVAGEASKPAPTPESPAPSDDFSGGWEERKSFLEFNEEAVREGGAAPGRARQERERRASRFLYSDSEKPDTVSSREKKVSYVFGLDFITGESVKAAVPLLKIRNENCSEIGAVSPDAIMKIIGMETMFCLIGGKNYRMWNIEIEEGGITGWVAGSLLERTKAPSASAQARYGATSTEPYYGGTFLPSEQGTYTPQTAGYSGEGQAPGQSQTSEAGKIPEEAENAFGGVVTAKIECGIPGNNYAVQIMGKKGGRFIWSMCKSKLKDVSGIFGDSVPCGMIEPGMWLMGELGGKAKCYGAGGSARMIIMAGFGKPE